MIDIEKSKWCLEPDTLYKLALDMEKNRKLSFTETETGIKECTVPLRSAAVKDVFYSIEIRRGPSGGEITINMTDGDSGEKVKVYENGRILRWGAWALELMQALPPLIARESNAAAHIKEGNARIESVLFDTLDGRIGVFFGKEEHQRILEEDKSGMLVRSLY